MKRLLLVDDHRIFRQTLATCLDSEYVVFTASTGIEALELLEIQDIDIMLLDVEMPEMNGIDTLRTLRKRNSTLPVIILTQFDEEYLMIHLLSLGANAFLSKDCGLNELQSAIAETLRTGKYLTTKVSSAIGKKFIFPDERMRSWLSPRELQVVLYIKEGKSNKEIAVLMKLELLTIESYRKSLMSKTRCRNAAELTAFAYKIGLRYTSDC